MKQNKVKLIQAIGFSVSLAWVGAISPSTKADIIAVYDAGGAADGSGAGPIEDLSTNGDTIGSITGMFSATGNADFVSLFTGNWNNNEFDFSPATPVKTATWVFGNLTPGSRWEVFASWQNQFQANLATSAPYTVEGTAVNINQEIGASAQSSLTLTDQGLRNIDFALLSAANANSAGEIVITLSGTGLGGGSDWVIADAIAIRNTIPEPNGAIVISMFMLTCTSWRVRFSRKER